MKLLSFGEILWDVYPDKRCIGGAPLNFAAHFVKLGGQACMLSAVGNDELGEAAVKRLKDLSIGTECVSVLNGKPTGACLVTLDDNGIPSYKLLSDTAYDFINPEKAFDGGFELLYFGTLALRHGNNRKALKGLIKSGNFKEIFADVNIRKPFVSRESIMLCIENATILKISDEELPYLSDAVFGTEYSPEAAAIKLIEAFNNIKTVIITEGEKGSLAYDAKGRLHRCAAQKVEVASTVGAGDSFSAAFLKSRISGCDTDECLKRASLLSAYVVSKTEAVPDYRV